MKKLFSRIIMTVAGAICALAATAATPGSLGIKSLTVVPSAERIGVEFSFNPSEWHLPLNKLVKITPVLRSRELTDSLEFPSISIAGKNSYYYALREDEKSAKTLFRSGKGQEEKYLASAEFEKWMEQSDLDFRVETAGCCGEKNEPDVNDPAAKIDLTPKKFSADYSFTPPTPKAVKTREISGSAYVNFPVNRTEIYPDYMVNPRELRKITSSIDTVRNDPDAIVRSITLTGYASPEGPYKNNVRLAAGRTEAVKEYVAGQYDFPRSVYRTNSVPEDWAGLRDSVAVSILPDRAAILEFIDAEYPIEKRNDMLRAQFPQSYAYLLKTVYPWLRHTNYLIEYELKKYTDVEQIKRIIGSNPGKLDLDEFYLAALDYGLGTPEAERVFMTAATVYPDNESANLFAGIAAMQAADYRRAEALLNRAGYSADSLMARANLAALEGNYEMALALMDSPALVNDPRVEAAKAQIATLTANKLGIDVYDKYK